MPCRSLELHRKVLNSVEVISTSDMNVEEEIFDPHSRVSHSIVRLDVDGFKPFEELMLHDLVCKAYQVCGALEKEPPHPRHWLAFEHMLAPGPSHTCPTRPGS